MIEHFKKHWLKWLISFISIIFLVYLRDIFHDHNEFNFEHGIARLWSDIKGFFLVIALIIGVLVALFIALTIFFESQNNTTNTATPRDKTEQEKKQIRENRHREIEAERIKKREEYKKRKVEKQRIEQKERETINALNRISQKLDDL